MPVNKFQAIILKRINLGEADRIVTAFSKEIGKIKFVAKGVRRTKSKFAGSIESFCYSEIQLVTGKSLDILTSANIIQNYPGLSPDLEKLKLANFIGEIVDKLIPDNTPHMSLFNLLDESLSQIQKSDPNILKIYFLTKFFYISGILPETNYCVKCGEKPTERLYFSNEAGGLVCENCALYFNDSKEIDVNTIKMIRYISENNFNYVLKLNYVKVNIDEVTNFLTDYLKYTSGKCFKSETI